MSRLEAHRIASILEKTPVWARLALTSRNDSLRERAADTVAAIIVDRLEGPEETEADERQMLLPVIG